MKKFFGNITNILLIVLLLIILFQRSCEPKPTNTETITTVETVYDTIKIPTPVYVPYHTTTIIHDTDTIREIDTVEVIKDYFTEYVYNDTVDLDTSGFIVINDTIFQNKIKNRQVIPSLIIPTTTITNTVFENKREWYAGINTGVTFQGGINYVGGGILFKTKRRQIYGLGVGINNQFTPTIQGSLYWRLGK